MDKIKSRCDFDIKCTEYKESLKNVELPLKVTVQQRKGVESSSWLSSISLYSGAFVVLLHGILHHSVRPIAQLTIGVCFVVEIFFLIKFLNKLLQFEFVLNVSKLFLRNFLLTVLVLGVAIFTYTSYITVVREIFRGVTHDEYLLIFSPSTFLLAQLFNYLHKSHISHCLSCIALTVLFCAYW